MTLRHGEFTLDDDRSKVDFERVHAWLSGSYWSPGVERHRVERAAEHSALVVGAYGEAGQVGYLRVVSDATTFAWVCDVWVDESVRGAGLGQAMLAFAQAHPHLTGLRRWVLATLDAHGVYEKCGFALIPNAERWMIYFPGGKRPLC